MPQYGRTIRVAFSLRANATNLTAVTLTNQLSPDLLRPTESIFTLGPGDSVEIEILGNQASAR